MTTISFKIDENLKEAALEYAKQNNQTLNELFIEALEEKIESIEDYNLAMLGYENIDYKNLESFEKLCQKHGIKF